jgi:diguanylate cyclase (GGDEF)-like protein
MNVGAIWSGCEIVRGDSKIFTLPRWRITRWLTDAGQKTPADIRFALVASLFGTLPIYIGGVINTLLVAAVITARHPRPEFFAWLALEFIVCTVRLGFLLHAHRAAAVGKRTYTDIYIMLGLVWAFSVGFGCFVCIMSGDWVASVVACLSAAAMVGGICFRNFGAPRMAAAMIVFSLGPIAIAALLSGQPILLLTLFQIPVYFVSMTVASYRLNDMLVSTMMAERKNDHLARHDYLTGLLNRAGLMHEMALRLSRNRGHSDGWALFYLDLDGFKGVNDRYGHGVGDQLLQLVTGRLRSFALPRPVIARMGGDEFVILCDIGEKAAAQLMAERLVLEISATEYEVGPCSAQIGVSIGIALQPDHGRDVETLLHAADTALYEAKMAGGRRCAVASADMGDWRAFPGSRSRSAVGNRAAF